MSCRIIQRLVDFSSSLLLLFLLLAVASSPASAGDDGIVRVKSAVPMAEAITRIKADIASKGIKFFSEIDQSQLAADAGISSVPPPSLCSAIRRWGPSSLPPIRTPASIGPSACS